MIIVPKHQSTHSDRLDRWLGADVVSRLTASMKNFYAPIAVHGVPGKVFAMPGGDFTGDIRAGQECSAVDRAMATEGRLRRELRAKHAQHTIWQSDRLRSKLDRRLHSFASMSAIITAATTAGKRMDYLFQKTGVGSNAIGNAMDLWTRGATPSAGAAGGAAPGGTVPTSATAGALPFSNASVNANTTHFTTGYATASVINNTLLLYDRLLSVAYGNLAAGTTQAVTGIPTRYTNQTATATDYIGGNFAFPSNPTTVLANTAHNWTVCQYSDQGGNGSTFPSTAGIAACVVGGVDLAVGNWFMPLAAGDVGVTSVTQMQSGAVATGTIDWVVAHPIAFFPCPIANIVCPVDGIGTAFNLAFIFDNACLAFMEMPKPATTATIYSGQITTVSE